MATKVSLTEPLPFRCGLVGRRTTAPLAWRSKHRGFCRLPPPCVHGGSIPEPQMKTPQAWGNPISVSLPPPPRLPGHRVFPLQEARSLQAYSVCGQAAGSLNA